jgi:hypothetical protein
VGFAIATLVGDLVGETGAERDNVPPRPTEPPAPASGEAPETPAPNVPLSWWLDGQFVLITALESGFPALGGQLDVSRTLGSASPWFVAGSARVAFQSLQAGSVQLSVLRPCVSAGVGIVALRLGDRVRLALRLEPIVELVEVTARDSATERSERGAHLVAGLKQAVDASWMWSQAIGFAVGAELNEVAGSTDILVHNELVTRVSGVNLALGAGIRLALP